MKVKALVKFNDTKEKVIREVGEEFIVNKTRFAEINKNSKNYDLGLFVEEVKEEKKTKKEDK